MKFLSKSRHLFILVFIISAGVGTFASAIQLALSVVVAPLPFADQNRIIRIRESATSGTSSTSSGKFLEWFARSRSFSELSMFRASRENATFSGKVKRIEAVRVTSRFFQVLKPTSLQGGFKEEIGPNQVMLSASFAKTNKLDDATSIQIEGVIYPIVGYVDKLPYPVGRNTDVFLLWIPTQEDAKMIGRRNVEVIGRLRENVSMESALSELKVITQRLEGNLSRPSSDRDLVGEPAKKDFVALAKRTTDIYSLTALLLLFSAVGTSSVLSLLRNQRQLSSVRVQRALGATNSMLLRPVIKQGLMCGLASGLLAICLCWVILIFIRNAGPQDFPRIESLSLNVWLAIGIVLTSTTMSLAIAILSFLPSLRKEFFQGNLSRQLSISKSQSYVQNALLTAKVCFTSALLMYLSVLLVSFYTSRNTSVGINTEDVFFTQISAPRNLKSADAQNAYTLLLQELNGLPGVEASLSFTLPIERNWTIAFGVDGGVEPDLWPMVSLNSVSNNFMTMMEIPLIDGRYFEGSDRSHASQVAIVSRAFADSHFSGSRALGKQIRSAGERFQRTIIGVVDDIRQNGPSKPPTFGVYIPFEQSTFTENFLIVRSNQIPLIDLQARIKRYFTDAGIGDFTRYSNVVDQSLSTQTFLGIAVFFLAFLAGVFLLMGCYGAFASTAESNQARYALLIAVGAPAFHVLSSAVVRAIYIFVCGFLAGVIVFFICSSFDHTARSNVAYVFATAAVMLMLVSASVAFPIRRALRVNPALLIR
jgi:predicted permease